MKKLVLVGILTLGLVSCETEKERKLQDLKWKLEASKSIYQEKVRRDQRVITLMKAGYSAKEAEKLAN